MSANECQECDLEPSRRVFVKQLTTSVAAILMGLGLSQREAVAMPIRLVSGLKGGDTEEIKYPLPAGDSVDIDKDHDAILVRRGKKVYGFSLACPHRNTALRWEEKEDWFKCPKHKSKYKVDGTFISGRATRNMDRLGIRLDGNFVFVDVDKVYQSDKDPKGWDGAVIVLEK